MIGFGAVFLFIGFTRKRKQAEILNEKNRQIEETLYEKQLLLKEVHHRVKNNFQIVSSLLELQTKGIVDEKAKELAEEGKNRVKSMALIHQRLYQNDDLLIHFDEYIGHLVEEIADTFGMEANPSVKLEIPDFSFDIDTAIPLGLIVNELVTNAFKYGLDQENKSLNISIDQKKDASYQLVVKDNGKGLPKELDLSRAKSLGLRLVRRLAQQLHGSVSYTFDNGSIFSVSFKDTAAREAAAS